MNIHTIFEQLKKCRQANFLANYDRDDFCLSVESYFNLLRECPQEIPVVFLAETDPWRFLAAFLAAIAANSCLFLLNPNWGELEWERVFQLVEPDLIFGNINYFPKKQDSPANRQRRLTGIMIPTGGSSGKIKFAIHTYETLTNSVQGFCQFFQLEKINSLCCLPLYHVSGLMQFLRSFSTQGKFFFQFYCELKAKQNHHIQIKDYFISLVPTQLKYLLSKNPQWLAQFKTVLVGGAPLDDSLKEQARRANINLALTYGMTETASGITILKTADFFQQNHSNGQVLPHAKVSIDRNCDLAKVYTKASAGLIAIESDSLFLGYYPHRLSKRESKRFVTDDVGYLDIQGYLHVIGRHSRKIITGGENVFPGEIERVILATGLVRDICVIGTKNPQWGEVVTAIYVPKNNAISESTIKEEIGKKLSSYKMPKIWQEVGKIPRNQQGKIDYSLMERTVSANFLPAGSRHGSP